MVLTDFILPFIAGGIIGIAAILLLLFNGRIAGISGILARSMTRQKANGWQLSFIFGLILSGMLAKLFFTPVQQTVEMALPWVLLAGFLVGAGSYLGNGCTSGHGICGIGRLSTRSITATSVFMATGVIAAMFFH